MIRQYIVTERAHFMCPNMHFGILVEMKNQYDKQKMIDTLELQAKAHPFLRSTIKYEDNTNKLYYDIHDTSMIEFTELQNKEELWDAIYSMSKKEWNPFENGLLKVFIVNDVNQITVLFMAHHLLGDGRCIRDIACEFADYYVEEKVPVYVEEHLIQSIEDLPKNSDLPFISKCIIKDANHRWKKEGKSVNYTIYADFVKKYGEIQQIKYTEHKISDEEYQNMIRSCKENQISVNDLLMSYLYSKADIHKLIMAVDIRKYLTCYREGALGNYATAFSVIYKSKTTNIYERAKEIHKLVRKKIKDNHQLMLVLSCYLNMAPELLDAAAISARKGFDSKAATFVGDKMFGMSKPQNYSLTNIGKIVNKNIISAMFIPPVSPAVKVTVGVMTVNDTMRICTSENVVNNE